MLTFIHSNAVVLVELHPLTVIAKKEVEVSFSLFSHCSTKIALGVKVSIKMEFFFSHCFTKIAFDVEVYNKIIVCRNLQQGFHKGATVFNIKIVSE